MLNVEAVEDQVYNALRAYHSLNEDPSTLLDGLLIARQVQTVNPRPLRRATNEVLLKGLDVLEVQHERAAKILRQRFLDEVHAAQVGERHGLTIDHIYRLQRQAVEELTLILVELENEARQGRLNRLLGQLPPQSYQRLFGIDQLANSVVESLLSPGEPWIAALVGIGGIGKTALADAVARRAAEDLRVANLAFVRVESDVAGTVVSRPDEIFRQVSRKLHDALFDVSRPATERERVERLRERLQTEPHLIIVDNVEETDHASYLYQHLQQWTDPTKFLITSRARPRGSATARAFVLEELGAADALELIRYQAKSQQLEALAAAGEEELLPIFETIGGNPYALKLCIALAEVMPLPAILADLQTARGGDTAAMYNRIYTRAWQALSEPAKLLLLSMPLIAETGGTPEHLLAASGLDEANFWPAVQELTARSLLEARGDVWQKRYGIHRLTETFLRTDLIQVDTPLL